MYVRMCAGVVEYFPPPPSADELQSLSYEGGVDEAGRLTTSSSRPRGGGAGNRLYKSPFLTGAFLSTACQSSDTAQCRMPVKLAQQQTAATG